MNKKNFINYEISEYNLIEKGTYADIIRMKNFQENLQKKPSDSKHNF